MDDQVPSEDRNRRGSLAISALLNDVAVDPCRSPLSDDHQQQQRSDYFTHRSDMVMFSSLPASPGCSRREADAIYVPEQRPTTSWDPATAITPDGLHHRKTSKGNIIVASIAKAKRKRISPDQFRRLMDVFEETDTPSSEVREKLAHELGMTKREVQVWFQNRRAKVSKQRASNQKCPGSSALTNSPLPPSMLAPPPPPPPPPPQTLQQQPTISFYSTITPPAQAPLMLQPIAPMPSYPTQMTANDLPPAQVRSRPYPSQQVGSEYYSYPSIRRPSSIHESMGNLSIEQDPPVRKRARSAIDVLASAAEYIGTEDSKTERAPFR